MTQTLGFGATHSTDRGPIDLQHYEAGGGLEEALSRHADEAYHELTDDRSRRIAELMFKRLTELGADRREVRRPSPLAEIVAVTGASRSEIDEIISHFEQQGRSFVTVSADDVLDISHESLIRQWPRLREWVHQEANSRDVYRRLAGAADRWGEGEAALLRNPDLELATKWWDDSQPNQAWADRYNPAFEQAATYLHRSKSAAQRRRMWAAGGVLVLALLTVVSVLLAVQANNAQNEAEEQTQIAETQAGLAEAAAAEAETQAAFAETAAAEAETQAALAEAAAAEAENQTRIAETQTALAEAAAAEAETQAALAEAAAAEAETQTALAEASAAEAENQTRIAETQTALAEASAAEAEAQRNEAEFQRSLAVAAAAEALAAQMDAEDAQAEVVGVLQEITNNVLLLLCEGQETCVGTASSTVQFPDPQGCDALLSDDLTSTVALDEISAGVFIFWQNTLSEPVQVSWISPNGVPIKWGEIVEPGEWFDLEVINGWVWVVEDGSGTCQMVIGGG